MQESCRRIFADPTADDYANLREIKDRLSAAYALRIDINDAAFEEDIQSVLLGFTGITDDTELVFHYG